MTYQVIACAKNSPDAVYIFPDLIRVCALQFHQLRVPFDLEEHFVPGRANHLLKQDTAESVSGASNGMYLYGRVPPHLNAYRSVGFGFGLGFGSSSLFVIRHVFSSPSIGGVMKGRLVVVFGSGLGA